MKFSEGYWRSKEGVIPYSPFEAREIEYDTDGVTVYAPVKPITDKGATLNCPLITVRFTSPMPDVIRVQAVHFKGVIDNGPKFSIHLADGFKPDISENDEYTTLKSGKLDVKIKRKHGWGIDFFYGGRLLTGTGYKNLKYITAEDSQTYMCEQLAIGVGENVFGLGERFTPFVKNGQVVDMWNEDGGTSSEMSYKNIPFYITSNGYGVFVNHPEKVSFEVASEAVSRVQFSVPGESLEYFIIGGNTLKEVLQNYTTLTGKPSLPPKWSFGLWLTTSFTTDYDEATVNRFIDGMLQRDIPLSVFHFDCFWMKEFQWCDFEWDKTMFPDPERALKRLKEKNLKICVWINPYIAQKSKLFDEGMEKGYLLKKTSGDVWQWDVWQAGMAVIDFTNPDASEWFADKLRKLVDMGVDCFKTDFGERIPAEVTYFDGSDPVKMHNYYTYLYNKVVFGVLEEKCGKGNAVVFARSATAGSQRFSVHWGGDCSATYESMAETLRGGLSLCMSGFGFWSHDISGFEMTATPDLYKRWTAFGLLSSHSRLHGNVSYRVPWLFDEEAVDVLRFFTKLKNSLMPYLYTAALEASEKGIPMMRPMVLEFPEDPACGALDRQYMLGPSMLVAPVFNPEGTVQYYLPEGIWTNFITGEKVKGGCWRKEKHGYMSIPLMVRSNSIIAVGNKDTRPDYDYAGEVTLHLFEIQDGSSVGTVVDSSGAGCVLEIKVQRKGNSISVETNGSGKPWTLFLRGINGIRSFEGMSLQKDLMGVKVRTAQNIFHFNIIDI